MKRKIRMGVSLGCSLLLSAASFGQITASNAETLVNSTTSEAQQNPAISSDTSGRYVVVWESEFQDGDGFGIYAQVYNADHSIRVPEFKVNASTTGDQRYPDVAMNPDGTFAVVWQTDQDAVSLGRGWDVYRRFYDVDGATITSEFRVNSTTSGNQMKPAVAASDDYFVVGYMTESVGSVESHIEGRFFQSSGAAVSSSIDMGISAGNHLAHVDVGVDNDNRALFVWQSDGEDGDRKGVFMAGLQEPSTVTFTATQVNTTTAGNQQEPSVAADSAGNAMIVWSSFDQDGDHYGIYSRSLNTSGTFSGGEVIVNSITANSQDHAKVKTSRLGSRFLITWTDEAADGNEQGVYAKYWESGSFVGSDELINTTTSGKQMLSDVAYGSDNQEAIFAWQSGVRKGISAGTDTDDFGVYTSSATLVDVTPPDAVCQNINVYLDGSGNVSIVATDVDGGSSDNVGITSYAINQDSFDCTDIGFNIVTLTVSDAEGLTDFCTAAVSVSDTTSPTAICQDLTVYLDGSGSVTITPGDIDNGSSDNCSVASTFLSQSSFTCADIGANTVTLSVTDPSSNIGTCTSTVTVIDSISPTAVCQDITVYLDGSGVATIAAADVDGGSVDNCGVASYSISPSSFTCADIGSNTVTLTVTDVAGNAATCTSSIMVIDSISPVASCQDLTIYLDGSGNASIAATDVDNGSSDNCGLAGISVTPSSFTCAQIGANTMTFTATDINGNTASCTSTITVVDSVAPTAMCQDLTIYLDGSGAASITTGDVDGGSVDNCGIASYGLSETSFSCADVGSNTVTLTVTDVAGNAATCTSTVTVIDSISPTAVCQDITVYLDGTGVATVAAADVDGGSVDNCAIASYSISPSSFTCADIGSNTVTLTVTDAAGNAATCTSSIMVIDSISPVASCQDLTVYLDGSGNASITATDVDNGSSDNCGLAGISVTPSSFTCAQIGANTVTFTATDINGNTASCTSTITVVDSVAPTAMCQDLTIYLDGSGAASITTGDVDGGSVDNCGIASYGLSETSFSCADVGSNTVTLTVTDVAGNAATCTSTVTVIDSISPTAICQDLTIYLDGSGNASIVATDVDNGSSDNCGLASVSVTPLSFTCAEVGTNTVTLTATDINGNTSSCTATVTVIDSIAPVTVVLADLTDECSVTASAPTTTDNCAGTITGTTTDPLTYTAQGSYVITWTFDDGNGNITSVTQNVDIDDVSAPIAPTLADVTGDCSATVTAPTTTDNCEGTLTGTTTDPLTYSAQGTYVVTWTFDDGNGNTSTATQNVIVDDVTAPVAPTLSDLTDECGVTATAPTATDNCSGTITGTTSDPLTYSAEGTYVITWTFDDGNGNTSTATQNVIIDDVTAPVAPTLSDLTDECGVIATTPTATDNCAGTITGTTTDPVAYSTQGTFVINWTFDDGNGNTSTALQNVIIDDVTAPTASNIDTAFVECLGDVAVDITLVDDEADNCVTPTVTYVGDVAANGSSCSDTITRTYNVADDAGNNIDVTQIIIVNDVTPPTASNPVTLNVTCLTDVPVAGPSWVTDEADNCGTPSVVWESDVSSNGTGCNDTITRSFIVSDDCGNSIVVQQLIIVNDDLDPVADNAMLADLVGFCDLTPTAPTATDNCTGVIVGTPDVTFPINTVGTTVVTWTFTDACGNTTTQTQNVIVEQIDVSTYMAGDGITIVSSNNDAGVTFQWIDCETDTQLPGETNQNFTPTYSSDFAVIVTQDGCVDTSDCVTIMGVGLDQLTSDEFILYPNPTTGQFTVSFDGNIQSIEMVDVTGRIVMTKTEIYQGLIDASLLAPGKYMVRLTSESGTILTQPIVIGQK